MRHLLMLAAALSLGLAAQTSVQAQTLDKNGRCHDAAGKFAKADVCKGAKAGAATPAAAETATKASKKEAAKAAEPAAVYKADAKGNCHDAKGKLVKKTLCKA